MKKVKVNRNKVCVNRIELPLKITVTKRIVVTLQNICYTFMSYLKSIIAISELLGNHFYLLPQTMVHHQCIFNGCGRKREEENIHRFSVSFLSISTHLPNIYQRTYSIFQKATCTLL